MDSLKSEHSSLKASESFHQGRNAAGGGEREKPLSSINRSKRFIYGHDSKGLISKPQRGAAINSQYMEDMSDTSIIHQSRNSSVSSIGLGLTG